jgi:hypothetical protein
MSEFLLHAVELLPNGKNGLRSTSARKVRAAEIRAQRLDGAQACGETAVHAPQSSAAGSGGVAGTVALEQFPRLLVWRSRAGGSKQMGRPQDEDTSARRLRAKSIVARGADRPLLENREKWRTPYKTKSKAPLSRVGLFTLRFSCFVLPDD